MNKENELLKLDATSKHTVISDLIEKNNNILQEIHELSLWKEEAEREQIASDILAKRIVELESEVARQRSKYQNAMKALSGMEEALLVRQYVCPRIVNMIVYISYTLFFVHSPQTVEMERQKLAKKEKGDSMFEPPEY